MAETPLRELTRSTSTKHAIVAHGQLCAVLAAATGAGASMLAATGVNAPTAQSAFVYAILALIYADDASSSEPGALVWLAIAIFDVEGNYLVVKAFQHTSMTSVMLLDCFAIPCVLVLSKFALGAQFTRLHLVGAAACVVGAALTVFLTFYPAMGRAAALSIRRRRRIHQATRVWPAPLLCRVKCDAGVLGARPADAGRVPRAPRRCRVLRFRRASGGSRAPTNRGRVVGARFR